MPGEELCYDYADASGLTRRPGGLAEQQRDGGSQPPMIGAKCVCGAAHCRGWMPVDERL